MTDIYERLADENEPAPATAPAAQLTGDQASELIASPMAEELRRHRDSRRVGRTKPTNGHRHVHRYRAFISAGVCFPISVMLDWK